MIVKYKDYTLILDFKGDNPLKIQTTVKELNYTFEDVSQAKRYIDTL